MKHHYYAAPPAAATQRDGFTTQSGPGQCLGGPAAIGDMHAAMPSPDIVPEFLPLAYRIRQCARLNGSFKLRSGKVSDTYFDKYQFEADPALLRSIAEAMAALVPRDTDVLAGLEMGGIPIVTLLSQVTGLPAAFIRKEPKAYGTCRYAEGTAPRCA